MFIFLSYYSILYFVITSYYNNLQKNQKKIISINKEQMKKFEYLCFLINKKFFFFNQINKSAHFYIKL